jgi:hypothetical protein
MLSQIWAAWQFSTAYWEAAENRSVVSCALLLQPRDEALESCCLVLQLCSALHGTTGKSWPVAGCELGEQKIMVGFCGTLTTNVRSHDAACALLGRRFPGIAPAAQKTGFREGRLVRSSNDTCRFCNGRRRETSRSTPAG